MNDSRAEEHELARAARQISTTDFSRANPTEIRALLTEINHTVEPLKAATAQLSKWHSKAIRGSYYAPSHANGEAVEDAATQLLAASRFLAAAGHALHAAEQANAEVRWRRRRPPKEPGKDK